MNIPNTLSLIRIALIPVAAYFFHIGENLAAAGVFIAACLTDILDGYIARHFNMVTNIGKILDPLADKGIQITLMVSLALSGLMPWVVIIFIACKEIIQVIGGFILYRLGVVVGAKVSGKISTVVTSLCVVIIMLFGTRISTELLALLQWLPIVFALPALLRYIVIFFGEIRKLQRERA